MTINLDVDKTIELLDAAVDARGADYIYPADQKDIGPSGEPRICRYVFRGPRGGLTGAGCIVGDVLARAGVPLKAMAPYDVAGNGAVTAGLDLIRELADEVGLEYTYEVEEILERVQSIQDGGMTWGEALTVAHRMADGEQV